MRLALAAAALCVAWPAAGQTMDPWTLSGEVATLRVTSQVRGGTEGLTGVAWTAGGEFRRDRVVAHARYQYGWLGASAPGFANRSIAAAELQLGIRPVPWLTVALGPRARAYGTDAGTRRWLVLDVRAGAEHALIPRRLSVELHAWRSVAGSLNEAATLDRAAGGAAGLTFQPRGLPASFGIVYRIEHSEASDPAHADTVEEIAVVVRYRRASGATARPRRRSP